VNDELRQRSVELFIGERQLLRGRLPNVDPRMALARGGDELLRRIDGRDLRRTDALYQLARQRPRAAADVEHALSRSNTGQIRYLRRQQRRVPPHEAVIGL